jgi:hypothetical protein
MDIESSDHDESMEFDIEPLTGRHEKKFVLPPQAEQIVSDISSNRTRKT